MYLRSFSAVMSQFTCVVTLSQMVVQDDTPPLLQGEFPGQGDVRTADSGNLKSSHFFRN